MAWSPPLESFTGKPVQTEVCMHVQQFRHAVQLILGNLTPDVDVKCVDPTLGGHYTPFPQVLLPWGPRTLSCQAAALALACDLRPQQST